MAIALDIIVALIIVLTVVSSGRKGFIKTIFDMVKFIASVIVAIIFKNGLANIIMNTAVYKSSGAALEKNLTHAIKAAGENLAGAEMLDAFEGQNPELVRIIESMGANLEQTRQAVANAAENGSSNLAQTAAKFILAPALESLAHIISFALIFIAALIILSIAEYILDAIFGLPVLHSFNTIGGILIGALCAVLYSSLFVTITHPIIKNPEIVGASWDKDVANETYIYSYIEQHNIISAIISE